MFWMFVCWVAAELPFSQGEAAASAGLLLGELVDNEVHVKSSDVGLPAAQSCKLNATKS